MTTRRIARSTRSTSPVVRRRRKPTGSPPAAILAKRHVVYSGPIKIPPPPK